MVHVHDLAHLGICEQRGLVDREFLVLRHVRAHAREARLEAREVGRSRARARELLVVERERAVVVVDRHERAVEAAFLDRDFSARLALRGERVALFARESLDGGDQVGRDSLRHHVVLLAQVRVVGRESVDVHRRTTRHRLDPARDDEILESGSDTHRAEVDRLLARTAEAIERDARCLERPTRVERRHARDVHRVVAAARVAAHDDVVDIGGIEAVAIAYRVEHLGEDALRVHVVECAGLFALASRRAGGVDDQGVSHGRRLDALSLATGVPRTAFGARGVPGRRGNDVRGGTCTQEPNGGDCSRSRSVSRSSRRWCSSRLPTRMPRVRPVQPHRIWRFHEYRPDGEHPVLVAEGTQFGGVLQEFFDFGPLALDNDGDGIATGNIFSSRSGSDYGVFTEAPGDGFSPNALAIGSRAEMVQYQSFRKMTDDASLQVIANEARLEAGDFMGNLRPSDACPSDNSVCPGVMESEIFFEVTAYTNIDQAFFHTAAGARLSGNAGDWDFDGWTYMFSPTDMWDIGDWEFETDLGGVGGDLDALAVLNHPVTVDVDLSAIAVGEDFSIAINAFADAYNRRGGESFIDASFGNSTVDNSPQITATGLKRRPPEIAPIPSAGVVTVPCVAGVPNPDAGTLQFDDDAYTMPEWAGGSPQVVVTRTGGSEGAVSADFTTSDGTAIAGHALRAGHTDDSVGRRRHGGARGSDPDHPGRRPRARQDREPHAVEPRWLREPRNPGHVSADDHRRRPAGHTAGVVHGRRHGLRVSKAPDSCSTTSASRST